MPGGSEVIGVDALCAKRSSAFVLAIATLCGACAAFAFDGGARKFDPKAHAVISTDRADGRYVSTRGVVQEMLRHDRPQLAFDPSFTPEQFAEWRGKVRVKLREVLGFPNLPPAPEPKFLGRVKREGYSVEKWEHYPMPSAAVPFLMIVPDGVTAENPAPAVLCMPGTHLTKESLAGEPELDPAFFSPKFYEENRMALKYAREGIVAVAVDNPGFGETSDLVTATGDPFLAHHDVQTFTQQLFGFGWSYMGYAAFVNDRLLERMRKDARIDRKRIATSGHSLGAWMAGYLAVLNEDVVAAVMNQGIYNWREAGKVRTRPDDKGRRPSTWGAKFFIPGLYRYFDHPDIQAAIAPRPALYCEGVPERDRQKIYIPAYRIAGAPQNLKIVPFEKYKDEASRFCGDLPEGILTDDEYWGYNSNDAPQHYFKGAVAVPWLKCVLRGETP